MRIDRGGKMFASEAASPPNAAQVKRAKSSARYRMDG
jgi:hypothetical protein